MADPVYLITGAARGIGLELVTQLSASPSTTILALVRSPSPELLALTAAHANIHTLTCDLSSLPALSSLPQTLSAVLPPGKQITHIINNAAIVAHPETTALQLAQNPEALHANVTTNVLGPAAVIAAALPHLAPNALVANIGSGIGSLALVSGGAITPRVAGYSVSKAALNMLSVHLAYELKGRARVVVVDPGHVKTRAGGEGASTEVGESVRGVLEVLRGVEEGKEGMGPEEGKARFLHYRGGEVAW